MSLTRRELLQGSLTTSAALGIGGVLPGWLRAAAPGCRPGEDRVLVVLQLTGGNDGLNTLVPYDHDVYARSRPTLRLGAKQVHRIADGLGLHPQLDRCARLFREGRLGLLQGVGLAGSSRNHAAAMRAWQTGDTLAAGRTTGWLGRGADRLYGQPDTHLPALFVSPIRPPLALTAPQGLVPAIGSPRELVLHETPASTPGRAEDNPLLDHLRRTADASHRNSRKVRALLDRSTGRRAYPDTGLGRRLRAVADLIRAGLGTRIYFTELGGDGFGGFDNHANQAGNHDALLGQLDGALAAFVADLAADRLLDRVLLMTFSEFGRTVAENGRRGTDHGAAAPVLLAGGGTRGGLLGTAPSLTALDGGALRPTADFRRLYATVLDRWLGVDSKPILGGAHASIRI